MAENDMTPGLTAEEQAQLDAQRQAVPPADIGSGAEPAATPQDGAVGAEGEGGGAAPPDPDKRPQMVPHAALHEERERRKEAERQATENQRKWEERFNALLQHVGRPQQPDMSPAPVVPPVETDPVGHIIGNIGQLRDQVQTLSQAQTAQLQAAQQAQAVHALQQRAMAQESEYRAANPDYEPAVNYLAGLRHRQLTAAGIVDPAERQMIIGEEARGIALRALQQNRNPAEVLHRLAEASGYAPPAANGGNGQLTPAAPDPAQRLQQIERGQQQARSVGSLRGSGPAPMTTDRALEMTPEQFLKWAGSPEAKTLLGR